MEATGNKTAVTDYRAQTVSAFKINLMNVTHLTINSPHPYFLCRVC